MLLVDRFGLLRACYLAAKQTIPEGIEAAAAAALAALHGITLGDGALSSWQGCRPARTGAARRVDRRLRHPRAAAAPGARLGLSAAVGAGHDPGARRGAAAAAENGCPGLGLDARVRIVGRRAAAGGQLRRSRAAPDRSSDELVEGLRTTAAHSTLVLADTNSTNILADGSLGKGVEDVTIDRSEDNDASRLEASHDGYVRAFGLIHKRSLMLGNDGKELRGADQLIAKGRKKIRESAAYAVRFHLAPGRRGNADRRRHGRDPPLAGRAAVEFPLPRRQC